MDPSLAREWLAILRKTRKLSGRKFDETKQYKFASWNVNGFESWASKRSAKAFLSRERPTCLMLQETKMSQKDHSKYEKFFDGYRGVFNSSTRPGYGGTAMFFRDGAGLRETNVLGGWGGSEGRAMVAKIGGIFVLNLYVPNSGEKLERLNYRLHDWDPKMRTYVSSVASAGPVICGGDMNCARLEIDVHSPERHRRSAGFTYDERSSFEKTLASAGLVDSFREFHPEKIAYTYWSYRQSARAKNLGWRLDYFLVGKGLIGRCTASYVMGEYRGSDHCPIGLNVNMGT